MRLSEPMTMLTDYLLAAVALALATRLAAQARRDGQRSVRLWAAGLLASAGAAALGGTYHGFVELLGPGARWLAWRLTVLVIGVSSLSTLSGSVVATLRGRPRRLLLLLAWAKLGLLVVAALLSQEFVVAVVDYVASMLVILVLEFRAVATGNRRWWFLAGLLVSFFGAGLQQAGLGFGPRFNHNDLYHVIQTAALFLLYQGATRLRDARA